MRGKSLRSLHAQNKTETRTNVCVQRWVRTSSSVVLTVEDRAATVIHLFLFALYGPEEHRVC